MELSFATVEIRGICENSKLASEIFGLELARGLSQRLADAIASENAQDFIELLEGDIVEINVHERELGIKPDMRIRFSSGHARQILNASGATEWSRVTRIRILSIETQND